MSEGDEKLQAQRLRLAADVFGNLSDANIDQLALILVQAYRAGQTPQQAAVDAVAYIDQCAPMPDPIPEPGPAVTGKEE